MQGAAPSPLDHPVHCLHGVGPEKTALLARLDVHTVRDLLLLRPRRHEDRRHTRPINSLQTGETAAVCGAIAASGVKSWRHGGRSVFECVVDDGTGRLHCRWWNLPYLQHHFHTGDPLFVFGRVTSLRPPTMDHPETERAEAGDDESIHLRRIVPVYPLTEGLTQRWLRTLIFRTLRQHAAEFRLATEPSSPPDAPPADQLILDLHFPTTPDAPEIARRHFALSELIAFQLELQRRRHLLLTHAVGRACPGNNRLVRPFLRQLGFTLTEAQTRVLREIRADLRTPCPMRRLLQGDVGSGKTVVAASAALMVLESGFNVALMAPTEILAAQHAATFAHWFTPLGLSVDLVTGSRKTTHAASPPPPTPAPSAATPPDPATPRLVIGTHALIQSGFALDRLGLVIIDEQHKFGVAQREQLLRKGHYPHLLVMTATPIPRTLGLTLYGDLDSSVIDAPPPGRGQVKTYLRGVERLPKVWAFVRQKLDEGRQAFFVYPRVEEDDGDTVKTVVAEHRRIARELAPHSVGMLHGQMPPAERDRIMTAFRRGDLKALVASSVIEVGLDVPNATLMVIENAERFGLAQLHQLRGRIGRGAHQSYCVLVADLRRPETRQRLAILAETHNGFRVAEADLQLRGPGEFLGQSQSGLPPFRFANLATDLELVESARARVRQTLL
ncbi:MAG: ATP-dependent DNA helicase RecG [Verrucomicrobia bacterium]|nr:ATP-dependent DNA helicase RecG [Verrucomicrobiota bacterium]